MAPEPHPRFSKQIRFPPIGEAGQRRLSSARVLLVGCGALGTHSASTLVRAGIGTLVLVDRDVVELDNLQRQLLFTEADARRGTPKAIAAAEHLRAVGGPGRVLPLVEDFGPRTFEELEVEPQLILDGTDNFATRYLLNDLAVRAGIPFVYGGAVGSTGTAMVVRPGVSPCLRCVLPEPPATGEAESCESAGILEPTAAAVAGFQTVEVLKLLTGNGSAVTAGVMTFDLWRGESRARLRASHPDPRCRSCGTGELPALRCEGSRAVVLCGRQAVQVNPPRSAAIDLDRLARNLGGAVRDLERTPHLLRFSAEGCSFRVFPGGRTLLFGVGEAGRARVLYDRYVGAS